MKNILNPNKIRLIGYKQGYYQKVAKIHDDQTNSYANAKISFRARYIDSVFHYSKNLSLNRRISLNSNHSLKIVKKPRYTKPEHLIVTRRPPFIVKYLF